MSRFSTVYIEKTCSFLSGNGIITVNGHSYEDPARQTEDTNFALDKVAPGTANDDTLLYGVEVKFCNMEVEVSEKLESRYPGLYIIGDGSGITHSLSHASASGVHVARDITK